MSLGTRVGLAATGLVFLGGVGLFLAPFVLEYQEVGEGWIPATTNDLYAGGILMALSALTLFIFAALALSDAEERRRAERGSQDKEH